MICKSSDSQSNCPKPGLDDGMTRLSIAPNFRDIGGLATHSGNMVRLGLVFRSEALLEPSATDAEALNWLGICFVCDLRSDTERAEAPNRWWRERGVTLLNLDILGAIPARDSPWRSLRADPDESGARAAMHSVYSSMVAASAPHLATILARIADGELPMLLHCTAGKDRTGFISAVLLHMLGVPRETVMSDYLESAGRKTPRTVEATRQMLLVQANVTLGDDAIELLMGVDRRYLEASFAVIDERHGSVELYLAAAGVSRRTLDEVRRRLVA